MAATDAIRKVIHPAVADDFELEQFLVKRACNMGFLLNNLRGKSRDELILMILKPAPSQAKYWSDLIAIAQTVAILGEGMKISHELATDAKNATGI
jgi:hypothetical protein